VHAATNDVVTLCTCSFPKQCLHCMGSGGALGLYPSLGKSGDNPTLIREQVYARSLQPRVHSPIGMGTGRGIDRDEEGGR
jgi:hypothetical protein